MSTWADLRALRDAGHQPAMALWVIERQWQLRANVQEAGAMVIDYAAGEPIEADLLGGLDVLLILPTCRDASAFAAAIESCEHKPHRCRAWCSCGNSLTVIADAGCTQ